MPFNFSQDIHLDRENGNSLRADAIAKENSKVQVALELLDPGDNPPYGYKGITGHWVFGLKMDLIRRGRFVFRVQLTDPPETSKYSSVMSRYLV